VTRHVGMQDLTPVVGDNEEAIENPKRQSRHSEEVHCGDSFTVIGKKRRPLPCRPWIPGCPPHPVQHGPFRDFEAEHPQFAMNSRRTPGWILSDHAKNEFAQFFANGLSTGPNSMPREPTPIQLESCSMPTDNGFGLNNENRPLPARPDFAQERPEELVGPRRTSPRSLPDHERKLLSQRQVFEQLIATRTEKPSATSDDNA